MNKTHKTRKSRYILVIYAIFSIYFQYSQMPRVSKRENHYWIPVRIFWWFLNDSREWWGFCTLFCWEIQQCIGYCFQRVRLDFYNEHLVITKIFFFFIDSKISCLWHHSSFSRIIFFLPIADRFDQKLVWFLSFYLN